MSHKQHVGWTFAITSLALFMVTLDNLVVTTALPVIRVDLHSGLSGLEWTVNAYTLTFAVLLLTGAALGDRFGRRRLFAIGLSIFTLASAAAALAPSIGALDAQPTELPRTSPHTIPSRPALASPRPGRSRRVAGP
jgi:MFS family permease